MNETLARNGNQERAAASQSSSWFTPRFDVYEDDNEYVLTGDLPGAVPENLDIRFEKQELSIFGKVEPRQSAGSYFVGEYGVGDFRRSFTVGEAVDGTAIGAELKDGVLTVHLPKRAEAKPRKIDVRGN